MKPETAIALAAGWLLTIYLALVSGYEIAKNSPW